MIKYSIKDFLFFDVGNLYSKAASDQKESCISILKFKVEISLRLSFLSRVILAKIVDPRRGVELFGFNIS